ncbi:MAG: ABC transporter ATP-binding protein [Propionibacteriaceae bacterium]|nr:ABC transporter ATP-binding protein [Propionibacteriaceae bacterium]
MKPVTINGLEKRYADGTYAVRGIDLVIGEGEFLTLLGPSGCGKTTTLRCLAGLEAPTGGSITFGDQVVADPEHNVFVPPEKRDISMVFQNYALWPHMTVFANVAYPLKMAKVRNAEIKDRVAASLALVNLRERAQQPASQLSGGQQQRVALARAMVGRPSLIFFDEPLSNLDAKLRHTMQEQIRAAHESLGSTTVYVTHDQQEALALSDRIVVMDQGKILQIGTPEELYRHPNSHFVADFLGYQNIMDATVVGVDADSYTVQLNDSDLKIKLQGKTEKKVGAPVTVAFRSAHLRLDTMPDEQFTPIDAVITQATYRGRDLLMVLEAHGKTLRATLDEDEMVRVDRSQLTEGASITLKLLADRVVALPDADPDSDTAETFESEDM